MVCDMVDDQTIRKGHTSLEIKSTNTDLSTLHSCESVMHSAMKATAAMIQIRIQDPLSIQWETSGDISVAYTMICSLVLWNLDRRSATNRGWFVFWTVSITIHWSQKFGEVSARACGQVALGRSRDDPFVSSATRIAVRTSCLEI